MISEKIQQIAKTLAKYGKTISSNAEEKEIAVFQKWVQDIYGSINVNEYIDLVTMVNGIDFNGLVVYSVKKSSDENIYNANAIWHENEELKNYLFYADADITWYCFDTKNGMFCELDKPSGELMQTFSSFNEMLESALDSVLA
jgi:hypothetical protein